MLLGHFHLMYIGAFDGLLQASLSPLAEFLTSLDRSSTTFVGFLAQTCFFSTVHMFSVGFKSGFREGHSKTSVVA